MAMAHDLAWRRVLEWIDGGPALPADLDAAVDQAAPKPAAGGGSRPAAALLAGALALGALAAYGAWRAEPGASEAGSGPATAATAHDVPDAAREPAVATTVRPLQQT